jgi:hypothetical protein
MTRELEKQTIVDILSALPRLKLSSKTGRNSDDLYEMRDLLGALVRGIGFHRSARLFSIWEPEKGARDRKWPEVVSNALRRMPQRKKTRGVETTSVAQRDFSAPVPPQWSARD